MDPPLEAQEVAVHVEVGCSSGCRKEAYRRSPDDNPAFGSRRMMMPEGQRLSAHIVCCAQTQRSVRLPALSMSSIDIRVMSVAAQEPPDTDANITKPSTTK